MVSMMRTATGRAFPAAVSRSRVATASRMTYPAVKSRPAGAVAADVHADMARAAHRAVGAGDEDEVAGLHRVNAVYGDAGVDLVGSDARDVHAGVCPRGHHETGAVVRGRSFGAEHIRFAQ